MVTLIELSNVYACHVGHRIMKHSMGGTALSELSCKVPSTNESMESDPPHGVQSYKRFMPATPIAVTMIINAVTLSLISHNS